MDGLIIIKVKYFTSVLRRIKRLLNKLSTSNLSGGKSLVPWHIKCFGYRRTGHWVGTLLTL